MNSTIGEDYYEVVFFFSSEGEITSKEINKRTDLSLSEGETLRFKHKEELVQLGQEFLSLSPQKILYLLSTSDFNIGLESCKNIESFKGIFEAFGTKVDSSEAKSKKSILKRIF